MLARLEKELPRGDEWVYEPKWDGFRAMAFADGGDVHIESRDGRALQRYFPEVAEILCDALDRPCVVDGEIILPRDDGLDFDLLLQRIHPAASRIAKLAEESPASFVAFDALADDASDLRAEPLEERRRRLLQLTGEAADAASIASSPGREVVTTPQTRDPDAAMRWFRRLEDVGLDGIIGKRLDDAYISGKRVMVKVKHERTVDCVVGGYRLSKSGDGIGSLLLGLHDDEGTLHYVGFTSAFPAAQRKELLDLVGPLGGGTSFGGGRTPGGPSRWNRGRDVSWVPLEPALVCEVAFDYMQGNRFRHGARWLRWRPDKPPRECTFDQLPPRQRPR
jgi:ATP-dependent DNA ligase